MEMASLFRFCIAIFCRHLLKNFKKVFQQNNSGNALVLTKYLQNNSHSVSFMINHGIKGQSSESSFMETASLFGFCNAIFCQNLNENSQKFLDK